MRLLVVTPFYAPDLGPSTPLVTMLCEDLAQLGHHVQVLAAVPHFPSGQVAAEYRGHVWLAEERNGVQVKRVWVPSGERSNLRHRLFTFAMFQLLTTVVGLGFNYDALLITNPALETFLPFAGLSWLRRKPAVFCVWDVYPDVGIHLGIFRHQAVIKLVGWLENFCLHRASKIHLLSETFRPSLQARGVATDKMVVIPPWLDTEFIHPMPRANAFSQEHGLNEKFVILYAGNIGFSQGLEHVLQAAQRLQAEPKLQFLLVGDGPNHANLVTQATTLGLTNVKFLPFQPRERLPELLATADLALVTQQGGLGNDSLPSKAFPILASGRPILATGDESSGLWKFVQQSKAGVCIPSADAMALATTILDLAQQPFACQQMGQHGREYALRYHSRQAAAQQFGFLILDF